MDFLLLFYRHDFFDTNIEKNGSNAYAKNKEEK